MRMRRPERGKDFQSGIYPRPFCRVFLLFFPPTFNLTNRDEPDWPSHDAPLTICLRGSVATGVSPGNDRAIRIGNLLMPSSCEPCMPESLFQEGCE